MSLNWKEIDLVLSELPLVGSYVQGVIQPSFDTLVLQLYRPGRPVSLLVSLTANGCRLNETTKAIKKSLKPLRFEEFLRKHVRGTRIEEAVQLYSDRIVKLVLAKDSETVYLFIRLWSNAGNCLLTDATGTILDCMFRRPKKGEVSGGSYVPGEPEKRSAREFAVRELPGTGSFNERVDDWYAEHSGAISVEQLREELDRFFAQRTSRVSSLLENLEKRREEFRDGDRFRQWGDLITSNLYRIKKGDAWLEAENFYADNATETIRLDPLASPQENAERYYEKARKAKTGIVGIDRETVELSAELARLEDEHRRMKAVDDPFVLDRFLRKAKLPTGEPDKKYPGLVFRTGAYTFLIGRSATENDDLLRHFVKGYDLWLHVRDFPGSYVFVKTQKGKSVPLDILLDAANLALFYSKGRTSGQGEIYYTQVKFLRRVKDGKKGLVLPTQEKNLHVKLDEGRLKRLGQAEAV